MNKSRFVIVFFALMLMVSLVNLASVIAQETNTNTETSVNSGSGDTNAQVNSSTTIDTETQKEVESMHEGLGAKVRVIQLKIAITRKIFQANIVIDYLKEKGKNTTELEDIVAQLEILKNETDTIKDLTNREEAIKKFVDIKKDSRTLIANFKTKAKDLLTDFDREEIAKRREQRKDELENQIKAIRSELDSIKDSFHEEQVKRILEKMNVTDEELLQKVRSGEITIPELKKELKEKYDNLSNEKKDTFETKILNESRDIEEKNKEVVKKYLENVKERQIARVKERVTKLEEKTRERAATKLRNAADKIENKSTKSSGGGH